MVKNKMPRIKNVLVNVTLGITWFSGFTQKVLVELFLNENHLNKFVKSTLGLVLSTTSTCVRFKTLD